MGEMYKEIAHCRGCGWKGSYQSVVDLGMQYVVDFPTSKQEDALRAPLELTRCTNCNLVQLKHSVMPDRLYKKFWYRSGISESMRVALEDVVHKACSVTDLRPKDRVLDIGCNDGTMLGMYPKLVATVGIDPAAELVDEGLRERRMDIGISRYFDRHVLSAFGPFKIITAISMFYDLEDPVQFLKDCKSLLHKEGILIIQMNYLGTMLEDCAVDNVCHEHLTYISMSVMKRMVEEAGLECQGAELNSVNGGSFRVYLTHHGQQLQLLSDKRMQLYVMMADLLRREKLSGMDDSAIYRQFGKRIEETKETLVDYLTSVHNRGGKIFYYGASTRGTTLSQLLGLPGGQNEIIRGAAERDTHKYGRMMVGSWTPIYSEDFCREQATHFVVLPWHFWETIKIREAQWMAQGGTMVLPLPRPTMVHDGVERRIFEQAGVR